ncbi:UPF0696 protein [Cercospora beticola]|uniref:UPF0696 protein n=1 Tax=Cercospora beticola TaxID=122368 RepID=A0A2G5HVZ9_CERBT|nr:UPF0696 protein [Cercospora beticola]PIA96432.1 UPF0696 protein [Cercospora beticola]WPB07118.1 hypothetical protein RHO25_011778 [Cercospora beticola]CAK1367071.1 unnamed protein product [Cercospora beticola]
MGSEDLVDGEGWISDDSSFYGDTDIQAECEEQKQRSLNIACQLPMRAVTSKRTKAISQETGVVAASTPDRILVSDRWLGRENAWQRDESVDAFLVRKPPVNPLTTTDDGWLWVGSPTLPISQVRDDKSPDLISLQQRGSALLEAFKRKSELEVRPPNSSHLERDLRALAIGTGVTYGKWMLFPGVANLEQYWCTVATATVEGRLGPTSKSAVLNPGNSDTLICVYTYDFSDRDDVERVLKALVDVGLCSAEGKPIYYKCDAYTYLGITSKNEYKLRASLYSSRDILCNKKAARVS